MDRGAWWATVHGVAKSRTRLSTNVILGTLLKSSFFVSYLFHILFSVFLTSILFCIMYRNMEYFKNFHVMDKGTRAMIIYSISGQSRT